MSQATRCLAALAVGFVCMLLAMAAVLPGFGYFEFGGQHVSGVWHAQFLAQASGGALAVVAISPFIGFVRSSRAYLYIGLALPPSAYVALYASAKLAFLISERPTLFAIRFAATVGLAGLTLVALSIASVALRRSPDASPPN